VAAQTPAMNDLRIFKFGKACDGNRHLKPEQSCEQINHVSAWLTRYETDSPHIPPGHAIPDR
jgi:hypothetical protein